MERGPIRGADSTVPRGELAAVTSGRAATSPVAVQPPPPPAVQPVFAAVQPVACGDEDGNDNKNGKGKDHGKGREKGHEKQKKRCDED